MRTLVLSLAGGMIFTLFLLGMGVVVAEYGTDYLEKKVMLQKIQKHVGVLNAQGLAPCDSLVEVEIKAIDLKTRLKIKETMLYHSLERAKCHQTALIDAIHAGMGDKSKKHALAYLNVLEIAQIYAQDRFNLEVDNRFTNWRYNLTKTKNRNAKLDKSEKLLHELEKIEREIVRKRMSHRWANN